MRRSFNLLLGAYGRTENPGQFEAWTSFLGMYPAELVTVGVKQAPAKWPDRMPSIGQIRSLVEAIIARRRNQERDAAAQPAPDMPAPKTTNPDFEAMARKWEQETIDLGLDPERPTPRKIAARRLAEFNALWSKYSPKSAI